jgi:hypothetical protein
MSQRVGILVGGGVPGLNVSRSDLRLIDAGFNLLASVKEWEGLINYNRTTPDPCKHFIDGQGGTPLTRPWLFLLPRA